VFRWLNFTNSLGFGVCRDAAPGRFGRRANDLPAGLPALIDQPAHRIVEQADHQRL